MNLFTKNLELIESIDKKLWEFIRGIKCPDEYNVFLSKNDLPTLKIRDTLLHSSYDPKGEAERWAEHNLDRWDGYSTPLVYGLGLGYHLLELLKRIDHEILVVEPDPIIFRLFLEYVDISSFIKKVGFLVSPHDDELSFVLKNNRPFLMTHLPSVNNNPFLCKTIEDKQRLYENYKILVVSPVYGGSLPIARYVDTALKELGYTVELVDLSVFDKAFQSVNGFTDDETNRGKLKGLFTMFLSELIMARVVEFKPDLVFALAQAPLTNDILNRIRTYKIPTAFWFVEDFRTMEYWKDVAPYYDYFFTIQDGEFFKHLKGIGLKNYHYLPMACLSEVHKPMNLTEEEMKLYGSDVSFVGAGYFNRRHFFPKLIDFDLKIWGNEWEGAAGISKYIQRQGERVSTEDSVKIFNASKININLHSSKQHEDVNPYGDFVNPRTFELASCGAFQIVDFRSDLPRFFEIGKEIVCFKDVNDAREKIRYFLVCPDEREKIAENARVKVLKEHTYKNRMEEMMGFIIDRGFKGADSLPGRFKVKDLIKDAGDNRELAGYLKRFIPKRHISLEDIIDDIHRGRGSLTKPETMFILMNEFVHRKG